MLRPLILGPTLALLMVSGVSIAGPFDLPQAGETAGGVPLLFVASADCADAAAEAAARTGGRVLSVSSRSDGGRAVCVVTLLVPADGGGRPRKQTLVLPQ